MEYINEIRELLTEAKLEVSILGSATQQYEAGLELIDAKVFLSVLRNIGDKSHKVLQFIANQRNVTVGFITEQEFHLSRSVLAEPYSKVGANLVYQPLNFSGNINDFADFLKENKKDMLMTRKALADANVVIAEYINNPKELGRIDVRRVPQLENIKELPAEFKEFFSGVDGVDRETMDVIYSSYSEFGSASQTISRLTKDMQDVDLKSIKRTVNDLYETIDVLMDIITKQNIQVSKPVAKGLGSLIYNLADWTAMYSLYISKLVSVSKSHKNTANKLNGFF